VPEDAAATFVCLNPPIGWFAVGVVWPSFESDCVRAAAISEKSELTFADSMVVLETKADSGKLYVPDPSRANATRGSHH
jgi:hypothetical protein